MSPRPLPVRRRLSSEVGGVASGIVVAVVILAALVVAGFFYFGGEADVDIKNPDIHISSTETPSD